MKTSYWLIITGSLLVIIFLLRECTPKPECPEVLTKTDTVVRIDTIKLTGKTVYKPLPYKVIDTFMLPLTIDTAKILADYIKLRKYNLSITNDSNSKINVFL